MRTRRRERLPPLERRIAQDGGAREGERYDIGEHSRRFLERARELKLKVVQWPTMNNSHPWRTHGGPFRKDRPEWLRGVEGDALGGANADDFRRREANCLACEPFYDWLEKIILDDALGTGLYDAWCMDGDFWGTGASFTPRCRSRAWPRITSTFPAIRIMPASAGWTG